MNQEIYILTHKKIDYDVNLDRYIPIQVGAALNEDNLYTVKDNIGDDNISEKNSYYLETTGIYWIWKHSTADIKGQMQLRRFLSVNPDFVQKILDSGYDIIVAEYLGLPFKNEEYYMLCHNLNDLLAIRNILEETYPEYVESYDKHIRNGSILYYSNSFICKSELYDKICDFCFSILNIFEQQSRLYDPEIRKEHAVETFNQYNLFKTTGYNGHNDISLIEYQERVCGYLFERLFTLYLLHNDLKIYHCGEYIKIGKDMSKL